MLVYVVWEKALCKHIDPSAFWATSIFYRAVSPSCKSSWCLQYRGLQFSSIIGCPCFHCLTYLVMQRTPLAYLLCSFLPTFQCVLRQPASFSPLVHCMVFISVVTCRSRFLFKAWLSPLCFFPSLGKRRLIVVQSLETINLVYPDNLCSHTNCSIVWCVWEERFSYLMWHCFLK